MSNEDSELLWLQADWLEHVTAWIHAQLKRLGLQTTGPITQPHIRPWSTALRVPTDRGNLYFKAPLPTYAAHETALTAALSDWYPDRVPLVLAADLERSWMLMTDGGVTLRTVLQADRDIRHWHRVLPLYAGIQQDLSARIPELLNLGVPDRRVAALPAQFEALLDDTDVLRIGQPAGLTAEEYRRLREYLPEFTALCAQLAAFGIPETLQHDDLHDNNILFQEGRYLLFDWGDSIVSHPFCTLLIILRSAERTLTLEENDPALLELRDLYLDLWTDYGSAEDLRVAFGLSQRIGMICRALTWYRVVLALEGRLLEEYAESISSWLQEFLQQEP